LSPGPKIIPPLQFDLPAVTIAPLRFPKFADGRWSFTAELVAPKGVVPNVTVNGGEIEQMSPPRLSANGVLSRHGMCRHEVDFVVQPHTYPDLVLVDMLSGSNNPLTILALPTLIPAYIASMTLEGMTRVDG